MPIDIKKIRDEIENGLPNSQPRRDEAFKTLRFANLDFEGYEPRPKDGRFDSELPPVLVPFVNRAVGVLSGYLYKTDPGRTLSEPLATEWLNRVYKVNRMAAKWKRADELTAIGGIAGFQFAGDTDPQAPVKVTLWAPNEIDVFIDPDEPTKPGAVATVDAFDNGQRLRLYTEEKILTWEKEKGLLHEALGSAAWRFKGEKANPYRTLPDEENPQGKGLIPFSFVHWFYPTSELTTSSPGPVLWKVNDILNKLETQLADSLPYQAFPIGIASGVDAAWKPPTKVKPGDWLALAATDVDAAGNGPVPQLAYLAPQLEYITKLREAIDGIVDRELELLNIPPAIIRMVQTAARSGLSIQAEQLPLVSWVEGRRPQWGNYEDDAAKMALLMGWNWLSLNGQQGEASRLRAALEDWTFSIKWPSLYTMLPGQERNAEDDWRLQRGFVSKIGVLMERDGDTKQEAIERLRTVEEENKLLEQMGIDSGTQPTAGLFPGMFSGGMQQGEGQDGDQDQAANQPPPEPGANPTPGT